jgi:peptidyl-tRNA hydrolase, PTH1 family
MQLFVGLGNPGSECERNRHNVGFMAVDRIASEHDFSPWKKRFQGLTAEGRIDGHRVILLKPQTYMNESGRSVGDATRFLKIPESDVCVLYDEIDLTPGKLKVKTGGGNAGHNGLRSISAHLGNDYVRVRIGIGHPGSRDLVANWVLRDFSKADAEWLEPLLDAMAKSAARLAARDHSRFMTDVLNLIDKDSEPMSKGPKRTGREPPQAPPHAKSGKHPEGDRSSKRANALADNLKKWLASRNKKP